MKNKKEKLKRFESQGFKNDTIFFCHTKTHTHTHMPKDQGNHARKEKKLMSVNVFVKREEKYFRNCTPLTNTHSVSLISGLHRNGAQKRIVDHLNFFIASS